MEEKRILQLQHNMEQHQKPNNKRTNQTNKTNKQKRKTRNNTNNKIKNNNKGIYPYKESSFQNKH